ncbi:hypothetical protein [Nocardia callitridis]|uniref:Uncharacterized protein n=1 Tax=Nocardia callitridis TaxID=648753 RepID=A0ABP9JZT1_9NOCA
MTDLEEPTAASTPLRRAAARLRAILPPGWRVEIVDAPNPVPSEQQRLSGSESLRDRAAVLRVVMP